MSKHLSVDNLSELAQSVGQLSIRAGEAIMEIYQQDFEVMQKADKSPVTEADLKAHDIITQGLQTLADYPVLSEEAADISFAERSSWETYWLVDPLDGTKQFVSKKGEFCVCIALIHQNYPILGVIHVPVNGDTYFASQGSGAFKFAKDAEPRAIACREPSDDLTIVASRSHRGEALDKFLVNLREDIGKDFELISAGSAIKACLVAESVADLYPRLWLTSEWDTAAAQCIVEEAGGQFTDLDMNRMAYNTKDSLLNPFFFVFGKNSRDWQQYLEPDTEK